MKSKATILVLLVLFATLLSCRTKVSQEHASERPNIIYIMLDEWGYYEWSAMGHAILPTLAELAGTGQGLETDGLSLLPTLLGEKAAGHKQEIHDYLFWEDPKSTAVRMGRWKAIRPAKTAPFDLYDPSRDIEELKNVADKYPDKLERMIGITDTASTPVRPGSVLDSTVAIDKIRHWKIN